MKLDKQDRVCLQGLLASGFVLIAIAMWAVLPDLRPATPSRRAPVEATGLDLEPRVPVDISIHPVPPTPEPNRLWVVDGEEDRTLVVAKDEWEARREAVRARAEQRWKSPGTPQPFVDLTLGTAGAVVLKRMP